MSLPDLPRRRLAMAPTPLEPLLRASRRLGHEVWVKRDDLTGAALTGNKVRKLEYLVAAAELDGADVLVTLGGVNSNHARATAVAAATVGMASHLVLFGEDRDPPTGNLLLDRWVGAGIERHEADRWGEREALLEEAARTLRARGRRPAVIPEGGSSPLGCLGYARAAAELLAQAAALGLRVGRVVHAVGSGGTTAGLALGLALAGREDVEALGIAVTADVPALDARVARILDGVVERGWASAGVRARARWAILDGHQGPGYARTTDDALAAHAALAREEGLIVDPVYTGKAFRALEVEASRGALFGPGATVFLHTGGIFEVFAHAGHVPP